MSILCGTPKEEEEESFVRADCRKREREGESVRMRGREREKKKKKKRVVTGRYKARGSKVAMLKYSATCQRGVGGVLHSEQLCMYLHM